MSKKNLMILISCVAAAAAAVTAVVLFHARIAKLIAAVREKLQAPAPKPEPPFTDEERKSFADI